MLQHRGKTWILFSPLVLGASPFMAPPKRVFWRHPQHFLLKHASTQKWKPKKTQLDQLPLFCLTYLNESDDHLWSSVCCMQQPRCCRVCWHTNVADHQHTTIFQFAKAFPVTSTAAFLDGARIPHFHWVSLTESNQNGKHNICVQ